jgi:hypothetical protein
MLQQRLEQWQEIESISQKMLDLALSNKSLPEAQVNEESNSLLWHEIASLDSKRMELLDCFFIKSVKESEVEFLSQKIQQVLALDKKLISISQLAQNKISQSFSKIGHQQRAAIAYVSCS